MYIVYIFKIKTDKFFHPNKWPAKDSLCMSEKKTLKPLQNMLTNKYLYLGNNSSKTLHNEHSKFVTA